MQATNKQAVTFLQHCKRIFANASDLQHLQTLTLVQQNAYDAKGEADSAQTNAISDAVLNSIAYFYCYRMDLLTDELCAVTSVLQEAFDMDANLDCLHLQTQEDLDGWITELQAA